MERKYTPGPWAHRNGRIYAADRENLTIANVARAADGDYNPANARLIAAAPDLVEALAAVRSYLAQCPPHAGDTTGTEHGRMMDAAGAALLKAGHDL